MKIAVINFSGNVGKSTVARHLLLPRIHGAELIAVESVNADGGGNQALRGRQFVELQEYLQTIDSAVVDIGASNLEELLSLMQLYRGSHEDFDYFIVPTVPALKQQQDTIATLIELGRLGVAPERVRLVFNMTEATTPIEESFYMLLAFLAEQPLAQVNTACRIRMNDIYARTRGNRTDLTTLANDGTNYKALIVKTPDIQEKLALAQKLATQRLANWVVPEHDACFTALGLREAQESQTETGLAS
ncbi:hypothetical protein DBR47_12010 [Paucibacter sp. KBW04]|uniref:StbB family protein n=1 Tax=Paucibacter sp. KBW04 TaxID=2153361 RepID=UPI000F58159D|nr:StbB family protein [Paucibacter sp. KBW04]RQO59364.1 hypothetical protein DBR47_12010 [Paucibacter sp. KBW04]